MKSCLLHQLHTAPQTTRGWQASCWRRGLSSSYGTVDDRKIHVVREGLGPHPLLLLPGALGAATSDFYPQLAGLSKEG